LKDEDPRRKKESYFSVHNRRRNKALMKVVPPIIAFAAIIAVLFYYYPVELPEPNSSGAGAFGSAHAHAALMLVLDGRVVDLAQTQYMVKDRLIHLEGMDGNTVHRHATEVNLGRFFGSLGIGPDHDTGCFTGDDGVEYCDDTAGKRLRFWINGEELQGHVENYVIEENNRVLVVYGNEGEQQLQQYLAEVNSIEIQGA
jgi:hypothetical protein